MNRELLQQALSDILRLADDLRKVPDDIAKTIQALEAELAKSEQEPVAWIRLIDWNLLDYEKEGYIPLFASPPRKESLNEFNPDWDTVQAFNDRIMELEQNVNHWIQKYETLRGNK